MSNRPPLQPAISILFVQSGSLGKSATFGFHSHEFWQVEVLGGTSEFLLPDGSKCLSKGDIVIIPPRQIHGFRYPGHGETYISAKFQIHGDVSVFRPCILRDHPYFEAWTGCVETLVREVSPAGNLAPLAAMLAALFAFLAARDSDSSVRGGLPNSVLRALDFIGHNGGSAITVDELADYAGVSRATLSATFRKCQGIGIKEYIDRNRIQLAMRILRFADLSISQVSDQLGFPDIFTFSRFFKRHYGLSPKAFRAGIRTG